jgi:hypothetical protein
LSPISRDAASAFGGKGKGRYAGMGRRKDAGCEAARLRSGYSSYGFT